MTDKEIIEQCNDFLRRSSARFSESMQRAMLDLRRYSGEFWDEDFKKRYRKGKNRTCLALNNWNVVANAIVSPFSASPWHTELKEREEEEQKQMQESIDNIEADCELKMALQDAFRKDVLTGYGFGVVSTEIDTLTKEPKIVIESVKHLDSVAIDPCVVKEDASDAEEGAIVNYESIRKAKRLYGEDVIPIGYPTMQGLLNINDMKQWSCPDDMVAIVSYYVKENEGVRFYKICGNKVVQSELLPISYIPIVRFAGNEIHNNKGQINYNGIVQKILSLELGANTSYSSLIERCGRTTKGSYLLHVSAIEGLENYYSNADKDDAAAVLWKGDHQPVPITEQFQTGDLRDTINICRTLMEDTVGVPLTGIPQGAPEKTATEILRQQVSKESNTASYYNNAYLACRTLSRIIIQLLNGGVELPFTLENGPSVITRQMKARQELSALATILPDNMKPIVAKFFADTLEDDVGKDLSRNILANLPKDLLYLQDGDMDPGAVHQLEMMKETLEQYAAQLDEQIAKNGELEKELDVAQVSLMENREARALDWEKFSVADKDKVALAMAQLQQKGATDAQKLQLDADKLQVESEKAIAAAQNATDKVAIEAQKAADARGESFAEGERKGYAEGVSDGVDASYGG